MSAKNLEAPDTDNGDEGGRGKIFILVVVTLLYVANYMDRMVLSATLPLIQADLGLTDTQGGWLGTIYYIVVALLTIPISVLVDRWSRKKAISIMAILWSLATYLTGVGGKFIGLFLARGGVGVGEAGFAPGGIAYISGSFPVEQRGRVLGVFNLGVPLGSILGIVIAGYVAEADILGLGWRAPFYFFAIPGLILGGIILFTTDYKTPAAHISDGVGGGVVSKGLWGTILKLIKTPTLILTYFGVATMSFVGGAVAHWLPTYFVRTRGIDVAKASVLMGVIIFLAMGGPILGGVFADRWRKSRHNARPLTASIIALLTGFALYLALFVDITGAHTPAFFIFVIVGILMFAYTAPAYAISQDLVPLRLRSISMGLLVFITYGTLAAYSPVVVGFLSDLFGSSNEPNLTAGFMFVPPVAFIGAILFFFASRYHDRDIGRLDK